ncbi:hypothetical protein QBC42DRAFT_254176 [Cladorrhinum samala]|uniref:Uncharacterized protein n=1 Tax=Cladorrhinum samala TaxID=585594 RepID=A0AAV9HGS2_9PEZI|nr:hypothetical protein QBC42DRAFT_254176 [Cladorrhinum samala]
MFESFEPLAVFKSLHLTMTAVATAAAIFLGSPWSPFVTLGIWGVLGVVLFVSLLLFFQHNEKQVPTGTMLDDVRELYETPDLAYEAVHGYRSCGCPKNRCLHGVWDDDSMTQNPALVDQSVARREELVVGDPTSECSSGHSYGSGRIDGRQSRFGFRSDPSPPNSPSADRGQSSGNGVSSTSSSAKSPRQDETTKTPVITFDGATNSDLSQHYLIFDPELDRRENSPYDEFLASYNGYWDVRTPSDTNSTVDERFLSVNSRTTSPRTKGKQLDKTQR